MGQLQRGVFATLLVAMMFAGCASPSAERASSRADAGGPTSALSGPKRVVIGTLGTHSTLQTKSTGPGRQPGYDSLEALVSAGLANVDDRGKLRPQLAEELPRTENGLWRLFPDGRM